MIRSTRLICGSAILWSVFAPACASPTNETRHFKTSKELGEFIAAEPLSSSIPWKSHYVGSTAENDCFLLSCERNKITLQVDKDVLRLGKPADYPLPRKDWMEVNWAGRFDFASLMIERSKQLGTVMSKQEENQMRRDINNQLRYPPGTNPQFLTKKNEH
jgi:hypothetical protein